MSVSKPSLFTQLILTVSCTVAIVMTAVAAISAIGAARALARETTAPGSVVDFAIRQAADGALYYRPVVAVALPDGSRRMLMLAEESADPAYSVDQSVNFAYDPAQPASARIKSTAARSAGGS